ncbi:hypothetical protein VI817_006486 [Penicillium citrinum]|nr:hypothetical protein VI817_006486 [Penicillium citrinum]
MAERNHRLRKHRDGLEAIISKAMKYVEEASKMTSANPPVINQDIPIYQHIRSTPDIHQPLGIFGEPEDSGAQPGSSATEIDCYMTSLLSDINGFPFQFQNEQFGTHRSEAPFGGVLGEDFWAAGTFDQISPDGFGWEI